MRPKRGRYGNKYADNKSVGTSSICLSTDDFSGPTDSGFQLLTRLITTKEANERVKYKSKYKTEIVGLLKSIVLVPFVPAMSPMEPEHSPFQGEGEECCLISKPILGYADYSDVNELIPDKPIMKTQQAKGV